MIQFEEEHEYLANIKVIGVGGGGNNAVNRMIDANIKGVEFIAANTDLQVLKRSRAKHKVQLGSRLTRGLGAGADPEVGQKAANEDRDKIKEALEGADMVFIAAGLGGGTGTGASPVIAEIGREVGALTVAIVTKPFVFEGKVRMHNADEGLKVLREKADSVIVVPNERLFSIVERNTPISEAFRIADDVLRQAVKSISELVVSPGLINVDFADVRTIMKYGGGALMGLGTASGEGKAVKAAKLAISCPLLEETSIDGARGVIVNITSGRDLTHYETNDIMEIINSVAPDANIIFGIVENEDMIDTINVTVIATGFSPYGSPSKKVEMEERAKGRVVGIRDSLEMPSLSELRSKIPGFDMSKKDIVSLSNSNNLDIPAFLRRKAD
ncbi:MAG: cell division protein FtsZ [bacterium]